MDGKKILIIDDDLDILETTGKLLTSYGFKLDSAETVEDGIKKIEEFQPAVILLDVMFPEKKTRGFEAIEEIKAKYPALPIIVFTAINREYAFEFNQDDVKAEEFVNKPVDIDFLVSLINQHT